MEYDGEVINFNLHDVMRYPDDVSDLNFIDVIEPLTAKFFGITNKESQALVLHKILSVNAAHVLSEKYVLDKKVNEMAARID